ncbi:hypothetical protein K474DRAFT_1593325 [Panus rudis PR-1116 ss-1]|nr:hypothetical protein K474DRAFT_1593325 [Panus rudis PR-1116 ss-1]
MADSEAQLPYDLIIRILELVDLELYYPTLYSSSLVNHTFNQAARRLLYKKVVLSPPWRMTLDLRRRDQELNGLFQSASLPHNAQYVLELEISGYLEGRPPPLNTFPSTLARLITDLWTNLHSITFTPQEYPDVLIPNTITALQKCTFLRSLHVNNAYCTEEIAPQLMQIERLESLTIENPSRAILGLLPEWLERLAPTLDAFNLKGNCGSVTPGVLRAFAPHLSKIHTFGLGLSYSLMHDDVLLFLERMPWLHNLELRYYLQIREPTVQVSFPALRSLLVRHTPLSNDTDARNLSQFIGYFCADSKLKKLILESDDDREREPDAMMDMLVGLLVTRHASTISILRMDALFISFEALKDLCGACTQLVELGVSCDGGPEVLVRAHLVLYFQDAIIKATQQHELPAVTQKLTRLYSIHLSFLFPITSLSPEQIRTWMSNGTRTLRRLSVNDQDWKVRLASARVAPSNEFFVGRVDNRRR